MTTPPTPLDPRQRFSARADDYARGRPGYPEAMADVLAAEAGLGVGSVVADVGSGTGISSEVFLRRGCVVYGVEPNAEMRRAAEARLADRPRFVSVAGAAEATTLPDASVDLVTVAQAFHWLDRVRARREFARILRPGGTVAVFWNQRRLSGTPFLDAYEALFLRYGTDYDAVRQRRKVADDPASLAAFFGGPYVTRTFTHVQVLDLDGVTALLLSASYTPAAGAPGRGPMLRALEQAFAAYARGGRVEIPYDTSLHFGPIADAGRRTLRED